MRMLKKQASNVIKIDALKLMNSLEIVCVLENAVSMKIRMLLASILIRLARLIAGCNMSLLEIRHRSEKQ